MKNVRFSEAVVIGAGPAGLGAAIGLARAGIGVTVFERSETLGSERRGETIRFSREMEEVLGAGLFNRIARCRINRRRYYSHSGRCFVDRTISNPNVIFNWPDLINIMADDAVKSGARIRTGTRVERLVNRGGRIEGVVAESAEGLVETASALVVSCGGHDDPASQQLNIDRTRLDMPVLKMLVKGYAGPDDRLEYHFHLEDRGLVVGTIFPRGSREAEIILLDTAGSGAPLSFRDFARQHPCFEERIRDAEPFYTLHTLIPMGGMVYPFMPRPGLVMAGDALGHVQARGGSGIRTSFLIGHAAGKIAAKYLHAGGFTAENQAKFEREILHYSEVRSLRRHNLIFLSLRARLFGLVGTPRNMDLFWPVLKAALR
jgi:flavin-dependent dehydrogenase